MTESDYCDEIIDELYCTEITSVVKQIRVLVFAVDVAGLNQKQAQFYSNWMLRRLSLEKSCIILLIVQSTRLVRARLDKVS